MLFNQTTASTIPKFATFAAPCARKIYLSMQINDLSFQPLLSTNEIQLRIQAISSELSTQYHNKCPLFICILNGAFMFASDLTRSFSGPCEITFVKLASYMGVASTGSVQTVIGLDDPIEGRHVIIVEDIVDSGRTLHHFIELLKSKNPSSICTVSLLLKPEALQFPVTLDYIGFEIPNDFVVGYGLDYNGLGRNLPNLHVLKPD